MDETFKTAIDFEDHTVSEFESPRKSIVHLHHSTALFNPHGLKFPPSVNLLTLRESLIAHAPFITRSNRGFWRKWLDTKQFGQILLGGYNMVSSCLQDNGSVNAERLFTDPRKDPNLDTLATNFAEMYFMQRLLQRDTFFNRLPEIMTYMIVHALEMSIPKHHRVYHAVKFRELLLDWSTELFGGVKVSYPRKNREWVFAEAMDSTLMIHHASDKTHLFGANIPSHLQGAARSSYTFEYSPLLTIYMDASKHYKPPPSPSDNTTFGFHATDNSNTLLPPISPRNQSTGNHRDHSLLDHTLPNPPNPNSTTLGMSHSLLSLDPSDPSLPSSPDVPNRTTKAPLITSKVRKMNPHALKITLSHLPARALMSMNLDDPVDGKIREKKVDILDIRESLRKCNTQVKSLRLKHANDNSTLKSDLGGLRQSLKWQLKLVERNSKGSRKDILSEILKATKPPPVVDEREQQSQSGKRGDS